jgi:hypothetical protein
MVVLWFSSSEAHVFKIHIVSHLEILQFYGIPRTCFFFFFRRVFLEDLPQRCANEWQLISSTDNPRRSNRNESVIQHLSETALLWYKNTIFFQK